MESHNETFTSQEISKLDEKPKILYEHYITLYNKTAKEFIEYL